MAVRVYIYARLANLKRELAIVICIYYDHFKCSCKVHCCNESTTGALMSPRTRPEVGPREMLD